jgi:hypothetical protein
MIRPLANRAVIAKLLLLAVLGGSATANAARFTVTDAGFSGGAGLATSGRFDNLAMLEAFDARLSSSRVSVEPVLLQDPPITRTDIVLLPSAGPFTLRISDLLANDVYSGPGALSLTLPGSSTVAGGTVAVVGDKLIYTPPAEPLNDGADRFNYLLTDPFGASVQGTVSLAPEASAPRAAGIARVQNNLTLSFRGLPNQVYELESSAGLGARGAWRQFPDETHPSTQTSDAAGAFQFVETLGSGERYFRAVDRRTLTMLPSVQRTNSRLTLNFRGAALQGYKLQSRPTLSEAEPWQDYPAAGQPYLQRAGSNGELTLNVPISATVGTALFFRIVPE